VRTAVFGDILSDKALNIYTYGTAWEFQGLISTESDLVLMKRSAAEKYYTVPAVMLKARIEDRASEWYKLVQNHCTYMLSAPYRCPVYVSEACNLICAQRERIKLRFTPEGDAEFTTLTYYDQLSADSGFDPERQMGPSKTVASIMGNAAGVVTTMTATSGGMITTMDHPNATQEVSTSDHIPPAPTQETLAVQQQRQSDNDALLDGETVF